MTASKTKSTLLPFILVFLVMLIGCNHYQENRKPNVLIILVDDLGYHDLSFTGSSFYETPNIDALASNSVQFSNAYASSPVCSPARASIMTGQLPSRHGITDWIGAKTGEEWRSHNRYTKMLPASNNSVLDTSHVTLPEAMKEAGYTTFIAGKWHIGGKGSSPEDHGFDINIGAWDKGSPVGGFFDPYKNPKLPNRSPGESLPYRLADETASFIQNHSRENPDKPFFAYLSFYSVHSPLQTTEAKWRKYRDKADSLGIRSNGFYGLSYSGSANTRPSVYAGLIEQMDEAIGHIISQLKESGTYDNTLIIFTSDNGGVSSGDHFSTTNYPLKSGKGSTFEGGIRVPFFMILPGENHAGKEISAPIISTDIYPTVLALTDLDLHPEQHIDGTNLMLLIEANEPLDRNLIWHYPHYSNQDGRPSSAIRIDNWKLIYDHETQKNEIYNLSEDPSELNNVVELNPELEQSMHKVLMTHLVEVGALFPLPDPLYDPRKEQDYLHRMKTKRLQHLERQRHLFLSHDFTPNETWWGSKPTND